MTPFRDLLDFGSRRALVTGAANGIGEAIARAYVALGAHVVLADRDEQALRKVEAALAGSCEAHLFDQADIGSIEALAAAARHVSVLERRLHGLGPGVGEVAALEVAGSWGSHGSPCQRKSANSSLRPWRTASMSCGSP